MLKNVWIRRLLWAAGAWLALWALAWLALPPLLKSQAESRGSAALGRTLTIGAIEFKPWTLELTVSDIRIATADGKSSQLAIQRLYADAEIQSLLRLAPVVDAITIDQPQLALTHLGDGHYDIDDVLQRLQSAPETPASAPLRFALYNLVLKDGSLSFTDHVGGAERVHSLRQLNLALPFLSSFDSQREVTVQPHLAFELNGSAFDSGAQATPFAPDAKGEASLQVTHLDIAPYLPYLPASLPVRLKAAVLDSSLKLAFTKGPVQKLVLSGAIKASAIRVDDKGGAPLLSVDAVQAVLTELRPLEHIVMLSSLSVTAPELAVSRNPAGAWNVLGSPAKSAPANASAATPAAQAASAPGAEAQPAAWQVALELFTLKDGRVRLSDASVSPAVQLALNDTQLEVRDVHWPFAKPATFEASANLQAAPAKGAKAAKPAHIALQGEGTDAAGSARVKLSELDLGLAAPYLADVLLPHAGGMLEGELSANWKGSDLQLQAPRLALHDFALTLPAGKTALRARDLPSFKLLEVNDLGVDLTRHAVRLGKLALQKPQVRVARAADGQWMFASWLAQPKPASAPQAASSKAPAPQAPAGGAKPAPWTLTLADATLADGTLTWVDRVPAKPVFLELSALQAHIKQVTLDGKKPVPLSLSAQVRSVRTDPGSLRFDGSLAWDPVLAQGTLEAKQFPAQALAPYGAGHLRLDLLRADTSFKGQVRYASLPAGPDVQVQGDAAVEELRLNSALKSASGEDQTEELLTWKALSLPGIDFTMSPAKPVRLKLREVSLSDFYARLIVNPEGRLVLQDLTRLEDGGTASSGAAAAQGAASAPQAAASTPAAAQVASDNDPVIEVGAIRLVGGHVAFSDRFIKPNYSADLTELSGSLGRFSSQAPKGEVQMADLDLRGRAEGTASLEIAGKVNPLAKPLALDVNARVRDLELSPLSSYAIKYAGYGIERGRLSVDLHYTVNPDGQLQASNKIILNQLVFGDEVKGASSPLPVKLAVALLADSNGVIDLDVPLSGSLNDPQFRVWPLVWKVVGNLIAKALTAPFSLISGLVSGSGAADELSFVAFDSGTATISAAALPGLDKVAQALRDKTSLRLTLEGTASLEREQSAMQRARLNALLLAEKRRQAASAGKDVTAVAAVAPEEYPALLKAVYKRSDIRKPRNLVGLSKDLPEAEMEALLLASLPVDEDAVRQLALSRSLAVREYLGSHQVPSERVFLGVVNTSPAQPDWQPRVELSIEHH
ncbi:DUF748 domain-containing protein [Rhodoferax lacus]|nr:DUF748 domain-containing protein [Rhodoferax lacus]